MRAPAPHPADRARAAARAAGQRVRADRQAVQGPREHEALGRRHAAASASTSAAGSCAGVIGFVVVIGRSWSIAKLLKANQKRKQRRTCRAARPRRRRSSRCSRRRRSARTASCTSCAIGDEVILVGSGEGGITPLRKFDEDEAVALGAVTPEDPKLTPGFADALAGRCARAPRRRPRGSAARPRARAHVALIASIPDGSGYGSVARSSLVCAAASVTKPSASSRARSTLAGGRCSPASRRSASRANPISVGAARRAAAVSQASSSSSAPPPDSAARARARPHGTLPSASPRRSANTSFRSGRSASSSESRSAFAASCCRAGE